MAATDDIDALIASTPAAKSEADLDALIANTPAEAAPTGRPEALARGGLQGATLGFGDEGTGGATAILQALTNALPQSARDKLDLVRAPAGEAYRYSRDLERARNKAAESAHGGYYLGGNLLGGLATAPLLPGLQAGRNAGLLARTAIGAANGLALGGVAGLGASEAELAKGELGKAATDMGIGAGAGALIGGSLPIAGNLLSRFPGVLRRVGTRAAKAALGASERAPVSEAAAQQALETGAIKPFSGTKATAERLEQQQASLGAKYGQIIKKLEEAGIQGPEASRIAQTWLERATQEDVNSIGSPIPDLLMKHAEELERKAGESGRIGLQRAINMTRDLQSRARYQPGIDTSLNDARKAMASDLRDAVEKAVAEQAQQAGGETQVIAKQFIPLKEQLRRSFEASSAADKARDPHLLSLPNMVMEAAHGAPTALAGHALRGGRGAATLATTAYGLSRLPALAQKALGEQEAIAKALRQLGARITPTASAEAGELYAP